MFLQIRMHIFDFVGGGRNSRKIGLYLFLQILWLSDDTNRKPVLFAIIAVVLPVAVSALFAFVIKMPLPRGIFGF